LNRVDRFVTFNAIDPELFDFNLFRFSFGEATEEAERKKKIKIYTTGLFLRDKKGFNQL
jgi:hypothetical protein